MLEIARALLAGEAVLVLGLIMILIFSYNRFKRFEFRFLQLFMLGLFVWISGIFLQLFMPINTGFIWGSLEFFSLQVLNLSTTLFLAAQYGFARVYRQEFFSWRWFDYLVFGAFVFTQVLILGENTVSSQVTFLPNGTAEILPGPWEAWFSFFTLFLILISIITLGARFFTIENRVIKKQFAYMFWGCAIFNISGVLTNWILPAYFDFTLLDFSGPLFFVIMAACLYKAALTCRFPDLKLLLHRYISFTTNLIFYTLFLWGFVAYASLWFSLGGLAIAYGLLLVVFWLTWDASYALWDKIYNYVLFGRGTNVLEKLERSAQAFDESLQAGVDAISQALEVKQAQWVFAGGDFLQQHESIESFFKDHPDSVLVKEELPFTGFGKEALKLQPVQAEMDNLMLAAAVPVLDAHKNLLGVLLLEQKVNGRLFSSQEIIRLKRILGKSAVFMTRERDYGNVLNKLKRDSGVKKEFVDGLMHEIRHPLMLARNVTDMIDWAKLRPEDQAFLKESETSLHDLSKKLELITEASGWVQGTTTIQKTLSTLKQVRDYIHQDMLQENPNWDKVMNLEWESSALESDLFYFDMTQIKRVFVELGKNALFFKGKEKLKVTVKVFEDGEDIVVHYTDNGMGIEKKYWDKIFDLMFVVSPSRNQTESGLGLGLAIARGIIRAHGGELKVLKSALGKGTTFEIRCHLDRYEA